MSIFIIRIIQTIFWDSVKVIEPSFGYSMAMNGILPCITTINAETYYILYDYFLTKNVLPTEKANKHIKKKTFPIMKLHDEQ